MVLPTGDTEMAKLAMKTMPISMFTFYKASNLLIGEMSMAERNIGRLYDDAYDTGLEIQGKHHKVRYFHAEDRDIVEHGEVVAFVFEPCYDDKRRINNLPMLHLLNT
jgi:hypothetical protein